jgi:(p)ppGpp synthase/HD superfamily hydrolase
MYQFEDPHFQDTLTDVGLRALAIATEAHAGQKYGDEPYIMHPIRVALRLVDDSDLYVAGLLHDVLEDSDLTYVDLHNAGIPKNIVDVVIVVTRRKGESYMEYIERVANDPSDAWKVKRADLYENLSQNPDKTLRLRYERALLAIRIARELPGE